MNGSDEADPTAPEFDFAALITIDVQCDTLDGGPLYVPGTSACFDGKPGSSVAFLLRTRRLPATSLRKVTP
jgi:hypothetical protein